MSGAERPVLRGPEATRAVHSTLGRVFVQHGFEKTSKEVYARPLSGNVLLLADTRRIGKFAYPGIASCIGLGLGVGTAAEPSDLRKTAMRHLGFWLRQAPYPRLMCETHNSIVESWRDCGPETARVSMLLGWVVREEWRNSPEVLWFRDEADLRRWAEFMESALPVALASVSRARQDWSHVPPRLYLDDGH